MIIKVPVELFDSLIAELATSYTWRKFLDLILPVINKRSRTNHQRFHIRVIVLVKEVKQLQKNISSEDITSEIIDTRARLETRNTTRGRYLEFLSKAGKIEDVLKIQQEINNIQEDIESAEARLAQLSGQVSYSTINLTYFEPDSGNKD